MKTNIAINWLRCIAAASALAIGLSGCGGGGGGNSATTTNTTTTPTTPTTDTVTTEDTLYGISVTPSSTTIKVGEMQQFKAIGAYVNITTGSTAYLDITSSVVWSSSAANVATVNASGLATAATVGTTDIMASSNGITDSATLNITEWTTRRRAPRSSYSLSMAFNGKTYVATNSATSSSSDLIVWDEQSTMSSDNAIAWNGSTTSPMFVRGGFFGMYSSTDGIAWSGGYNTSANPPNAISYSSTLPLWVAVGNAGYVYRSSDGVNWSSANPTSADLYSVVWTGTKFVAAGVGGTVITSPDGVNWTAYTLPVSLRLGVSPSLLVGCSAANENGMYTSTDGINWTYTGSTIAGCNSVIYAGGKWVAVGLGFSATSSDGTTWTKGSSAVGNLQSVVYDGTQYVASGTDGLSSPAVYTSPDGNTWKLKSAYTSNISIARSPATGRLVVVTSTDKSLVSTDNGITWQYGGFDATQTGAFFTSVTWYPALNTFIAVGGSGLLSSSDGLTWTPFGTEACDKIEASPSLLVSSCTFPGLIYTSVDGANWAAPTYPSTQGVNDTFWTGSQWVALGNGGDIVTSPNGTDWTLRASGTTNALYGSAASPSVLVAVGYSGTIVTSSDNGATWTKQTSVTSSTLKSVVWTGTRFVAVGNSGVVVSSTNGINWTTQPTGYDTLFASDPYHLNDIIQAGTSLVLIGTRGLISTSP